MANQRLNATITIGAAVSATLGRAVGDARRMLGSLGGANGVGGIQSRLGDAIDRNNAALDRARLGIADAVGAYYALRGAIGAPVQAAADFETMLEDIGQKAGTPTEKLAALGEQIKQVARDTNQSATTIGQAVDALAGRGASLDVALAAADPIGKAATAYRAATDDLAAASWSAVDNLKVPADQIETALDAMAAAGKSGAFELRDMAQYFPSLGAAYQGLGQSGTSAVADLAAALQVVRKGTGDSASAATNLQNVLQKIYANPTKNGFKKLGISIEAEMKKAAEAGKTPIEAIAEITNRAIGGDLSRLGEIFEDAQVQAGMRSMIQGMDEFRRIRAEALGASGTIDADYERRIRTAAGAQARWNASVENLSITFGTALLPALNDVLDKVVPIVAKIGEWVQQNPTLVSTLAEVAAGLIAFKGATSVLKFVGLIGKGGALELAAIAIGSVGSAVARLAGGARGALALQTALGRMGGETLTGLQKVGVALRGMVQAVPGVDKLGAAFRAVSGAVAGVLRNIGLIGPAMSKAATATEQASARMASAVSKVKFGGLMYGVGAVVAAANVADTPEGVAAQMAQNRAAADSTLRSVPGLGWAMRQYEGARDWLHGAPEKRAVGGYFGRGPVLVGERGPELRFENRAGFIATARQTAALAAGGGGISVGAIHIHALPGMDPRRIADEVLRVLQDRARGALFDGGF